MTRKDKPHRLDLEHVSERLQDKGRNITHLSEEDEQVEYIGSVSEDEIKETLQDEAGENRLKRKIMKLKDGWYLIKNKSIKDPLIPLVRKSDLLSKVKELKYEFDDVEIDGPFGEVDSYGGNIFMISKEKSRRIFKW